VLLSSFFFDKHSIFSFEWYTRLMQTFHINNIGISPEFAPDPTPTAQHDPVGLFQLLSFVNHSCAPNARLLFLENHHGSLVAQQDIHKGDEITIAYVNPELPYKVRSYHLEQIYGFKCTCEKCSEEMKQVVA
jgi:hypothetical protein